MRWRTIIGSIVARRTIWDWAASSVTAASTAGVRGGP
jgi:hypothetical protein